MGGNSGLSYVIFFERNNIICKSWLFWVSFINPVTTPVFSSGVGIVINSALLFEEHEGRHNNKIMNKK